MAPVFLAQVASAQELLRTLPRFERYEKMRREASSSIKRGELSVQWDSTGKSLFYSRDGQGYRHDLATGRATPGSPPARSDDRRSGGHSMPIPERGRQVDTSISPDGKRKAFYRNGNVYVGDAGGGNERSITKDGDLLRRIKYGTASWVYGEELFVREAMWWSPDSSMLAFYRFDESQVPDAYFVLDYLESRPKVSVEAYPKAGQPNPAVDLLVYDFASGKAIPLDVRFDGGAGTSVGHYVYEVQWSPDGRELLFNRTNRKQNTMEFCAADPRTGKCRVIVREQSRTWTDNAPSIFWIDEKREGPKRFLWRSERTGFYNWYLYDLSGKLHHPVTRNEFEADRIVRLDPTEGVVYYLGRSSENPYLMQLHRVDLGGSNDQRLTDPKLSHSVSLAPDGRHFVDVAQAVDQPPVTRLLNTEGKIIATLAESDATKFGQIGLKRVERFTFRAADGRTMLYGNLHLPSDFNPSKKYPLLVNVYGGPESSAISERFRMPNPITELGCLYAEFDGRGTLGRGKAFKDAVYGRLGMVDTDDQAAGVKALRERPYIDGAKVGIYGTSYGGYMSAIAILRYPDLFQAALANSPVTDWRLYDSIYTERYMGLPEENKAGYDAGSCIRYAPDLKGALTLFYGTADNNVHPTNTYQLVAALRSAGKRFTVIPGPDEGHSALGMTATLEFFAEKLGIGR